MKKTKVAGNCMKIDYTNFSNEPVFEKYQYENLKSPQFFIFASFYIVYVTINIMYRLFII